MSLDPEIVMEFRNESNALLKELSSIVEQLEETRQDAAFPSQLLSDFAQRIDRIMGAANTIAMMDPEHAGLIRVGKLAEICKALGYQAASKKEAKVIPLFAAFWADTIEVLSELLNSLDDSNENAEVAQTFSQVLQKRLEWLAGHVGADARELGRKFS